MTIELLDKQADFIEDWTTRELLYSGGYGSGKSVCLCWKLVIRATSPGAREGLCRKHFSSLRDSTLKTLIEGDGDMPPILPRGTYVHNKSEKTIKILGGGSIQYFGLDDPDKKGSYNFSGCGVDEAAELEEDDYRMLRSRIRMTVNGMTNQLYAGTNPKHPMHHLAIRFGFDGGQGTPGCRGITATSAENTYLPPEYLADLGTFVGVARQRYYEGLWVGSQGLVYPEFSPLNIVRSSVAGRVIVAVDDGYTHPFAALRIIIDGDGRFHIDREIVKSGLLNERKVEAVNELAVGAEAVVVDSAAAGLIASLADAGLPVMRARKGVEEGREKVRARLPVAGDNRPRLTMSPSCTHLIAEFNSHAYRPGSEEVDKRDDHALDALRYGVMYEDGGRVPAVLFGGESRKVKGSVAQLPTERDLILGDRMWSR